MLIQMWTAHTAALCCQWKLTRQIDILKKEFKAGPELYWTKHSVHLGQFCLTVAHQESHWAMVRHITFNWEPLIAGAGDWTWDLLHAKQGLYHWEESLTLKQGQRGPHSNTWRCLLRCWDLTHWKLSCAMLINGSGPMGQSCLFSHSFALITTQTSTLP